jgi:hypothetical protein
MCPGTQERAWRPANALRAIHDQSPSVPFSASRAVTPVPSQIPTGNFCPQFTFHASHFTPTSSPNCTFSAPFLRCFQRRCFLLLAPQPLVISNPQTAQFLACRAEALGEGGLTLTQRSLGATCPLHLGEGGVRGICPSLQWLKAIGRRHSTPTHRQPVPTHANLRTA